MFSSLATKIALKKAGIPSNALDFSSPREPNKLRKDQPADDQDSNNWSSWLSYKSLPLTVHPWLSPPPPPIQVQGWKEKGWLGDKVAEAMQRKGTTAAQPARNQQQHPERRRAAGAAGAAGGGGVGPGEDDNVDDDGGVSTVMGNKWQESGAFAVDGRGTVIWGGKAMRADDVMDLEEGAKLLAL
ncbi:hypothetical protein MAA_09766 [Metarhizium robertsii ARSEF 23]|uniref:Uncharacterized protein n=1 Tax=Metarhizium robertsii (strain ARSEF 23 / ATCC MYA-3075) TaxID=655844 RepID=E9FBW7_METRA|nr:uncharacterized protein MAA_09766 [Metarhizium robertsii ARSEF 23]EFY94738.1 hypothetical protein MAA_09766 [Metarhizium robertsii ARSEF 23]